MVSRFLSQIPRSVSDGRASNGDGFKVLQPIGMKPTFVSVSLADSGTETLGPINADIIRIVTDVLDTATGLVKAKFTGSVSDTFTDDTEGIPLQKNGRAELFSLKKVFTETPAYIILKNNSGAAANTWISIMV